MRAPLLRNRNFVGYVTANAATVFPTAFLQTSLSLYMLDLTGSAGKFGLSLMIGQVPNLLLGLIAGAIVDPLDRRKVMMVLARVRVALLLSIFLWSTVHPVTEALIYVLTATLGLCQTLTGPAQIAMMPSIVPKEQLVDANALNGTLADSLTVAGPVLAAVVYSLTGIGLNVLLCAVLFAIGGAALAALRMEAPPARGLRVSVLTDILAGFGLFRRELRLASLVFNGFLTHLFLFPLFLVGFPYIIKEVFHCANVHVGIVESAATIGSISSVLLVAAVRKRVTVSQGILWGIIGMILAVLPMSLLANGAVAAALRTQPLYVMLFFGAVALLMFWMFGAYGVFYVTFYQSTVSVDMLGRYYAMQALAFGLARMVGFQLYGHLLDHYPLVVSIAVLGAGMIGKLLVHIPFMRIDAAMRTASGSQPHTAAVLE